MEESDKKQAKPSSPNIRDEHGTVIVAWLWKVVQIAFWTALVHVK